MKQFNLDEYLKDTTQKVVTRDGRSVRIVCTDYLKQGHPVLALVLDEEYDREREFAYSFSTGGEFTRDCTDDLDLFFADKETYRPYANAEECFKDVIKHGGWVMNKQSGTIYLIIEAGVAHVGIKDHCFALSELLSDFVWGVNIRIK